MQRRKSIKLSLELLSVRERYLLVVVSAITLFLALLDLLGVLLIGVITSLFLTDIAGSPTGNRVNQVITFLGLKEDSLERQILVIGLMSSILLVSKTIATMFLVKKTTFFMARRAASISANLVMRFLSVPITKVNRRSVQNSIYSLTDGVASIMIGILGAVVALISDLSVLLVLTIGLFFVDTITAIGSTLLFGAVAYLLHRRMNEKMKRLGSEQAALSIQSSQRIFESIQAYRELFVRGRRHYYAKEIGALRFRLAEGQATISFMKNITKYFLEISLVIGSILLAAYQFQITSAFRATATISVFIAASTRITPAILRIQQGVLSLNIASAQAAPTFSLIKEITNVEIVPSESIGLVRNHNHFLPEVTFDNVSFQFSENDEFVIQNVDLEIKPGEFVAIVGESGAGKSTLADLLIGALEPSSGNIKISGVAPEKSSQIWPGAVAYVPQESTVIEGSVRSNLGIGFKEEQIEDVYCWEALKLARMEEFVSNLPKGLDEELGDRGTRLSGGQKQRLGIARALITLPKILILDEATSSLDGITEFEITRELKNLKGDITIIVIAHRLSTVVDADCIYFMKDGRFLGSGTFLELKEKVPEFVTQAKLMGM